MKTLHSLLVTTAFVGGLAATAFAGGDKHTPGSAGAAGTSSPSSQSATGSMAGKDFKADHMMSGTVSEIDQSKGDLTVKTSDGEELTFNVPSSALKDYKEGDQVSIAIAKRIGMTGSGMTGSGASGSGASESTR